MKYYGLFSVYIDNRPKRPHPLEKICGRRTIMNDMMQVMPEIDYEKIGKAALIWFLLKVSA